MLVLSAAVLHATWNYLAKRAYGGIPLVWLYGTIATLVYSPFVLILFLTTPVPLGVSQIVVMLVSSGFQLAYFLLLTKAYQVGDLSLVYPLARGTGPLLSTLFAILLFSERPSPLAIFGALLIALGIFVLTGDPRKLRQSGAQQGLIFALLTGVMIASYTLWDKAAVSVYLVPPLLLNWVSSIVHMLTLFPVINRRREAVRREWRDHRWHVL